jgi:hypothetical protein
MLPAELVITEASFDITIKHNGTDLRVESVAIRMI